MKRVFGKKKESGPAPSLGDAQAGLATRVEGMDAKIASLENELRGYKDKIKKTKSPAAKQQLQKRAMEVLKRKRMYENQRDQATAQQFNIDQTNFSLESAKATVTTVAAMKSAQTDLKRTIKKELNVDDVDGLADDMAELMEDFDEINDALGRNFTTPDDIDEADLDAELEMLGEELDELEDDAEEVGATPSYLLPEEPGHKLPEKDQYGLPAAPIGNN